MSTDVRRRAMDLLARREHSWLELKRKLLAKGFEGDQIDGALDQLRQEGLQSDARFTEAYVTMRANRGYGPQRIQLELRERGVADAMIDEYVNEADEHWHDRAAKVAQKKFGNTISDDFKERSKQMQFLRYRGFTTEQIKSAFTLENDNAP